jgi:hypothetical protein
LDELRATLEREIAGEKAAALGRSGRRLKGAIRRLQEFDARSGTPDSRHAEGVHRAELVADAADAYWSYVVQREAMGLTASGSAAEAYDVPEEVRRRAGPRRRER